MLANREGEVGTFSHTNQFPIYFSTFLPQL